jgi:putative NADPH-quinone reductase
MKTLIIVAHPDISTSVFNKRLIEELQRYPDKYTIHELTSSYPDGKIDVVQEQKRVEAHDNLVLQFPIQWFSCPAILKSWLDDVLTHGWAYGKNGGDKLKNKKVALAVTAGIRQGDYQENGKYHYSMEQILTPFDVTFRYYCHANYRSFFACYGAELVPGEEYYSTTVEIEQAAKNYLEFLENL